MRAGRQAPIRGGKTGSAFLGGGIGLISFLYKWEGLFQLGVLVQKPLEIMGGLQMGGLARMVTRGFFKSNINN